MNFIYDFDLQILKMYAYTKINFPFKLSTEHLQRERKRERVRCDPPHSFSNSIAGEEVLA